MSALELVLIAKIGVSIAILVVPFLCLPKDRIDRLSGFEGTPVAFYRLYGVAILALLVGYGGGLHQAGGGEFPWGVAAMGIVSNGGAVLVLIITGRAAGKPLLTAFFGAIAAGLIASAAAPQSALQPL